MQTLFGLLLTAVNSALFALAWFMYYRTRMYIYPFFIKGDVIVVLLFALLFYMFAHLYSGFDVVFQTAAEMMYSNTVAAVISCGIMYVITALLIRAVPNVLPMLVLVVGCVAMSGLLSFCVKRATARFLPPRATLLVYGNPEARKEGEDILRRLPGAFYVLDSISADVGSEELCRQIFRWDARAVMLCGVPSSERNDLLKYCIDRNIEAYVRPNIGDLLVKAHEYGGVKGWKRAAKELHFDIKGFLYDQRPTDAVMPWDTIDTGLVPTYLTDELKKAETGEFTIPCFDGCRRCHICGGHHDEVGRT